MAPDPQATTAVSRVGVVEYRNSQATSVRTSLNLRTGRQTGESPESRAALRQSYESAENRDGHLEDV